MTPWRWLRRLAGPLVALLGVLVGAFYRWRARKAKAGELAAKRDAAVLSAGRDHEIERVERREEVIDALEQERTAAVDAAGRAALGAAEAGDARPAGVLLRDVLRPDGDGAGVEPVRPEGPAAGDRGAGHRGRK